MSTSQIPPLALERFDQLRRLHRLADATHRRMQEDRNALHNRVERAALGLEIVKRADHPMAEAHAVTHRQPGTPYEPTREHPVGSPSVVEQAARDVERARAEFTEHAELTAEAAARSTMLGDAAGACSRLLRDRFGWREHR